MATTEMPLPDVAPEAWDYLHINSVDKMLNSNYLISGRHTDCIYEISGIDGTVLLASWRCLVLIRSQLQLLPSTRRSCKVQEQLYHHHLVLG
jgi:hypothetical protein